ncbi:hypothetical protein BH09PSE6_BH09PSE6_00990 [soil metagenome]
MNTRQFWVRFDSIITRVTAESGIDRDDFTVEFTHDTAGDIEHVIVSVDDRIVRYAVDGLAWEHLFLRDAASGRFGAPCSAWMRPAATASHAAVASV